MQWAHSNTIDFNQPMGLSENMAPPNLMVYHELFPITTY